jgi:hypothetical protein
MKTNKPKLTSLGVGLPASIWLSKHLLWSKQAPKLALAGVKISSIEAAEAGINIPDAYTDDYVFTDNPTDTACMV